MQEFFQSFSFVVGFMVSSVVFQMIFGEKFVQWFLILVLLSMIIVNSNDFITFLNKSKGEAK